MNLRKDYFKKTLVLLLSVILILSGLGIKPDYASATAKINDIQDSQYKESIKYAVANHLLTTKGRKFFPDHKLTRGEAVKAFISLLGAEKESDQMDSINDVKEDHAYYQTMSSALNADLISPDFNQNLKPDAKASKMYVAKIISKITGMPVKKVLGIKNPVAKISRGEFAQWLKKFAPCIVSKTTNHVKKGNVVINQPDITLKDVTVTGNLIIGDGVGDKEVTLENVTVIGETIVRGGGENSIIITGSSNLSSIVIKQVNNKVSLKVKGDAKVSMVYINDGCNDVNIVGAVGSLTVAGEGIHVTASDAVINETILKGANTSLSVTGNTTINKVELAETAKGASLKTEEGSTVKSVAVNASNASVEAKGTLDEVNVNAPNAAIQVPDTTKVNLNNNGSFRDGNPSNSNENSSNSNNNSDSNTDNNTDSNNSSSSSSNNSSNGNNKPTNNTNPAGTYETDERFVSGYPQVKLENGTTTAYIQLKNGVATDENPAEVYYIASYFNNSWGADTTSVLHGHLGIEKNGLHRTIQCDCFDSITVTGSGIYRLPELPKHYSGSSEQHDLNLYFVIATKEKTSQYPTKISFDDDTVSSFLDEAAPRANISALNTNGDQIYLYLNEAIDPNHIPAPSEFEIVTGDGSSKPVSPSVVSISAIDLKTEPDNSYDFDNYFVISLTNSIQIEEGAKLFLHYTGESIRDMANIPNQTQPFYFELQKQEPKLSDIYLSEDGTWLSFELYNITVPNNFYKNLPVVKINNKTIDAIYKGASQSLDYGDYKHYGYSDFDFDYAYGRDSRLQLVYQLNSPVSSIPSDAILSLEEKEGGILLYSTAGEECNLNNLSSTITSCPPLDFSQVTATYNQTTGKLSLQRYDVFHNFTALCNFKLEVNGIKYSLRGDKYYCLLDNEITLLPESYKHIDFKDATSFQIYYEPYNGSSFWDYLTDKSERPADPFVIPGTVIE